MSHPVERDRNLSPRELPWIDESTVTTIDEALGIYISPSLRTDTRNPTFWHWCTGVGNGPRWLATGTGLHTVISTDPWTIGGGSGSLLCTECGLHGWIRDGNWISA